QPGVNVLDLLEEKEAQSHELTWHSDPHLTAVFARKLVSSGHPARAIQRLQESLKVETLAADLELIYLLALAFVRGGNEKEAEEYLHVLERTEIPDPALYVDVHALRGRMKKDEYRQLFKSGGRDDKTL